MAPILKPLIAQPIWESYKVIHSNLLNRGVAHEILYHQMLSTIFEPKDVPDKFKSAVFNQSIDILVLSPLPGGAPLLVVDVASDAKEKANKDLDAKRALFSEYGVNYLCVTEVCALDICDMEFSIPSAWDYNSSGTLRAPTKRVVHEFQYIHVKSAQNKINSNQFILLHEVALNAFIEVDNEWIEYLQEAVPDDPSGLRPNFLRQTTVDALIATPPPNSIAIVAIEYDGKYHRRNPDTIAKDKKENITLDAAGVPVIRFNSLDTYENKPPDEYLKELKRLRIEFLGFVAERLSRLNVDSFKYIDKKLQLIEWEIKSIKKQDLDAYDVVIKYVKEIRERVKQKESDLLMELIALEKRNSAMYEEMQYSCAPYAQSFRQQLKDAYDFDEIIKSAEQAGEFPPGLSLERTLHVDKSDRCKVKVKLKGSSIWGDVRSFEEKIFEPRYSVRVDMPMGDMTDIHRFAEEFLAEYIEEMQIIPYIEVNSKLWFRELKVASSKRISDLRPRAEAEEKRIQAIKDEFGQMSIDEILDI